MDPSTAPYGWLVKRMASRMEQNINNFLKPYNITSTQSWVVLYLKTPNNCFTYKELEKQFEVSQPTMVGILSRLEQKNMIIVSSDEKDRRIKKVRLSSEGAELIVALRQHLDAAEDKIVSDFSEKERETFHLLLEKSYRNIMESEEKND